MARSGAIVVALLFLLACLALSNPGLSHYQAQILEPAVDAYLFQRNHTGVSQLVQKAARGAGLSFLLDTGEALDRNQALADAIAHTATLNYQVFTLFKTCPEMHPPLHLGILGRVYELGGAC